MGARGWGRGKGVFNGDRVSVWGEEVLKMDGGDGCTTM